MADEVNGCKITLLANPVFAPVPPICVFAMKLKASPVKDITPGLRYFELATLAPAFVILAPANEMLPPVVVIALSAVNNPVAAKVIFPEEVVNVSFKLSVPVLFIPLLIKVRSPVPVENL